MNRRERDDLCELVVEQFKQVRPGTYQDACRRVGMVMSGLLRARVELKFVSMRAVSISGATALRSDGTYVVYCANSCSWYHRLGILLHELAHLMLGHQPISLDSDTRLRRFIPHLPSTMTKLIAGRTAHSECEEREAEELADELLNRIIEERRSADELGSPDLTPGVLRVADGLAHHTFRSNSRER